MAARETSEMHSDAPRPESRDNASAAANGDRRPIKSRESNWAKAIAAWLARRGVSANQISISGMAFAIGAGAALVLADQGSGGGRSLFALAAALAFLRLLANMFDGMVAVEQGRSTPGGALYNEIPDRISDAAIFAGAGMVPGATLELGLGAASVSIFVAYVRAADRVAGAPSDFRGPMAKQQRMAVIIAACLFLTITPAAWSIDWGPQDEWGWMAAVLWVVIVGGIITAALRLAAAARYLLGKG